MGYEKLTAKQIKDAFRGAQILLGKNKVFVDSLNVFPVPDGDTGTNMHLTLSAAINEMEKANDKELSSVLKGLSTGALMGARGNSGVILSQLFRGFSKDIKTPTLEPKALAEAFKRASDMAYRSVIKPVEGTILTVAKATAEGAVRKANEGGNCLEVLQEALLASEEALKKTPTLLPVLAEAGVVDAGGQGWVCIIQGLIGGIAGKDLITEEGDLGEVNFIVEKSQTPSFSQDIEFRYCTELIVKGKELNENTMISELMPLGDSLLVVGDEEILKIHIHTNSPGLVLEKAAAKGILYDIKIDNMEEQHQETIIKEEEDKSLKPGLGLVAVSAGDGLSAILKSLGVDVIIPGGQTMNPSTEELLAGVRKVGCEEVIIMPNNKNIILAAEQAQLVAEEEGIRVSVIPSRNFPQSLAAMLAYNPMETLENNTKRMNEALEEVLTGEITYAVRDSQFNGRTIKKDQILGLLEGEIVTQGDEIGLVTLELLKQLVDGEHELLSIFYGENIEEEEAIKLKGEIEAQYPHLDVEIHLGGQPLYHYILGLE